MVLIEELKSEDVGNEEPNKEETAEDLKLTGNNFVKNGDFKEAILSYTKALKLSPNDFYLYSNRSLAFLKSKHYYHALTDAERTINLNPQWPKGFFRKAEVQREVGEFDLALLNYGRALQLSPSDQQIINIARKTAALSNRESMLENKVPWVGSSLGLIVGIIIVICDHFTQKPSINHPAIKVFLVIIVAIIGFFIAKGVRYYLRLQRKSLLEPPAENLFEDINEEVDDGNLPEDQRQKVNRTRYTKSQARYRFKKGKT
jgi:tetratricopeptide (TPR) repeat protein